MIMNYVCTDPKWNSCTCKNCTLHQVPKPRSYVALFKAIEGSDHRKYWYRKPLRHKNYKVLYSTGFTDNHTIGMHRNYIIIIIAIRFSAEEIYGDYREFRAILSSDGRIRWEPGGVFKTMCEIDITYFPFDEQVGWRQKPQTHFLTC